MKKIIFILISFYFANICFAQSIGYEVRGSYKQPILKEKLIDVKTISDINPGYPASWISGYISVVISATCKGFAMKAESRNDTLSNEQQSILKMADMGTDIIVDVKYNTSNSSKKIDVKTVHFLYTIIPKIEAEYIGGYELLKQYLKKNAIDKIPETIVNQIEELTIGFTISENGKIIEVQITKSSGYVEIDNLLSKVIIEMPRWKPAENSHGIKVKQDFQLGIGMMIGC